MSQESHLSIHGSRAKIYITMHKNANTNQNKAKNVATSLWVELRAASGKKDFTMTQGLVLQTTRAQPI